MPIEYALINDVWGKPARSRDPQNQRQDPACGLLRQRRGQQQQQNKSNNKQGYDNIMDTYMDEPIRTFNVDVDKDTQHYDLTLKPPTRAEKCGFDVVGVSEDYGNALSFDRYFADDNIFDNTPSMYSSSYSKKRGSPGEKKYNSSYTDEEQEERKAPMMDWSAEASHPTDPEPEEEEEPARIARFAYNGVDDEDDDYTHKRSNTSSLQKRDYMDLALYVFSGVFLIFFMEQVLQLGMYIGH